MRPLRAVTVSVVLFAALASAQTLSRGPYLQSVTPSSIVIGWRTSSATDSVVRFGAAPDALGSQVTDAAAVTDHFVKLTGLTPNTRYFYSVGSSSAALTGGDVTHFFRTSPSPGSRQPIRLWILGDSGTGTEPQFQVRDAMLGHTTARRPELLLHLGDIAYESGTDAEFTNTFFAPYAPILRNTTTFPTLGNHEGRNSSSSTQTGPYYQAYSLPKAAEAGGVASGTEAYYSFDYGNAHFVVLDSQDSPRAPDGAMLTWLKNDLAATNAEWLIAYWHHPPFSKGTHDTDDTLFEGESIAMRSNALPLLDAAGVDLVLTGHSHIYERSYLVDGAYDTPTTAAGHVVDFGDGRVDGSGAYKKLDGLTSRAGAVYVVAGHGGRGLGRIGTHPLMYFTEQAHGSGVLDIEGARLDYRNVRADGVVSDSFTLAKGNFLSLVEPDGGELYLPNTSAQLRWSSFGNIGQVKLELSIDDGLSWTQLAAAAPNTGSFTWTTPVANTTLGRIRISDAADPSVTDTSARAFRVNALGGFRVTQPNGGETLQVRANYPIRWTTIGAAPRVVLSYSLDRGETWTAIGAFPNSGEYVWQVPVVTSAFAKVKVAREDDPSVSDESDEVFSIAAEPVQLVGMGESWRYDDRNVDPGASWMQPGFDDSGWKSGNGQFGFGDTDQTTVVADADPNIPSYYFRKKFTVNRPVLAADLRVLFDDGAAVFLNGKQVVTANVGSLAHGEWAASTSNDNEQRSVSIPLDPNPFVEGENTLAVVVKQASASSSDLSFDLQLTAQLTPIETLPGPKPGGCGCRTAGGSAQLLLLGAAALLLHRRRRAR